MEELAERSNFEDIEISDEAEVMTRLFLTDYLEAKRGYLTDTAQAQMKELEMTDEAFFESRAYDSASIIVGRVIENAQSEGRNHLIPGDLIVAIQKTEKCEAWPVC